MDLSIPSDALLFKKVKVTYDNIHIVNSECLIPNSGYYYCTDDEELLKQVIMGNVEVSSAGLIQSVRAVMEGLHRIKILARDTKKYRTSDDSYQFVGPHSFHLRIEGSERSIYFDGQNQYQDFRDTPKSETMRLVPVDSRIPAPRLMVQFLRGRFSYGAHGW